MRRQPHLMGKSVHMWTSYTKMFTCEHHIRYFGEMKIFKKSAYMITYGRSYDQRARSWVIIIYQLHIPNQKSSHVTSHVNIICKTSYTKSKIFTYEITCEHHIQTSYTNIIYDNRTYHMWTSYTKVKSWYLSITCEHHMWTSYTVVKNADFKHHIPTSYTVTVNYHMWLSYTNIIYQHHIPVR